MRTELRARTVEHVCIQYDRIREPEIWSMIPMTDKTLEQAIADYEQTQLPGASSYGRTIYVDGAYAGDIWCYCMNPEEEPNAMIGYCLFEKQLWGKGITTEAVKLFLEEVTAQFGLKTMGAVAYCSNAASLRVLEKSGFEKKEEFEEDGILSAYYQKELGL